MKCPFCGSEDTQVVDTRANLEARPTVTLLWTPADDPAYSLLVDGTFVADLDVAQLRDLDVFAAGEAEAVLQQQFSTRTEQVERAHAAFSKKQTETAAALRESYAAFTRDLASAQSKALAEIDLLVGKLPSQVRLPIPAEAL